MEILKHRVNSINDFDQRFGVEVDIRDHDGELVVSHNYPNKNSLSFFDYLKKIPNTSLLAINVKSSGIEKDLKKKINAVHHDNYFVFDFSIPDLYKALEEGLTCAFRVSEYEKDIHSQCSWAWVDSFHSIWFDEYYLKSLKNKGFKIAIVSPELHNRSENNMDFKKIKEMIGQNLVDAICTNKPEYWRND